MYQTYGPVHITSKRRNTYQIYHTARHFSPSQSSIPYTPHRSIHKQPPKNASNQHTRPITPFTSTRIRPLCGLRRSPHKTRRHIQRRVPFEEVARSQKNRHWLRWHDRIILRRWEMRQPEGMPKYDVGVFNGAVGACCFDPSREALRRFAGGLGDVSTGRVDLIVGV